MFFFKFTLDGGRIDRPIGLQSSVVIYDSEQWLFRLDAVLHCGASNEMNVTFSS